MLLSESAVVQCSKSLKDNTEILHEHQHTFELLQDPATVQAMHLLPQLTTKFSKPEVDQLVQLGSSKLVHYVRSTGTFRTGKGPGYCKIESSSSVECFNMELFPTRKRADSAIQICQLYRVGAHTRKCPAHSLPLLQQVRDSSHV